MTQPVRKTVKTGKPKRVKKKLAPGKRPHPKYGTSKLEDRFAKEFLDRLGYKYIRQYEAREIGRFYDFCVLREDGKVLALIEVDGDYYHGHGLVYEEKSPMQKHNEYVDKVKNQWAHEHEVPLLRIWEHDINDNQTKVIKTLKTVIGEATEKQRKKDEKNKRH